MLDNQQYSLFVAAPRDARTPRTPSVEQAAAVRDNLERGLLSMLTEIQHDFSDAMKAGKTLTAQRLLSRIQLEARAAYPDAAPLLPGGGKRKLLDHWQALSEMGGRPTALRIQGSGVMRMSLAGAILLTFPCLVAPALGPVMTWSLAPNLGNG